MKKKRCIKVIVLLHVYIHGLQMIHCFPTIYPYSMFFQGLEFRVPLSSTLDIESTNIVFSS